LQVSIAYWHARYNLGMTISHAVWVLLVKYAEEFCTIDDYNWDWSLVYLAQQRFNNPRVMWSSATRVIHLGSW
jgi:alpha-1,6-mannosyl-glycoprotein beta-1,2-N-acetylglucosaminyltransferase